MLHAFPKASTEALHIGLLPTEASSNKMQPYIPVFVGGHHFFPPEARMGRADGPLQSRIWESPLVEAKSLGV
jgi:hypothetical protein